MNSHPQLDFAYEVVHTFGIPAILAAIVWGIRTWDRGQQDLQQLKTNTTLAVEKVTKVEEEVGIIKTNHLVHLSAGIETLNEKTNTSNELLHDIKTGILILVDRSK